MGKCVLNGILNQGYVTQNIVFCAGTKIASHVKSDFCASILCFTCRRGLSTIVGAPALSPPVVPSLPLTLKNKVSSLGSKHRKIMYFGKYFGIYLHQDSKPSLVQSFVLGTKRVRIFFRTLQVSDGE